MSEVTSPSFLNRMRESLSGSAGDIVYGMEDGAVSIFGLVLGVAVGAQSGSAVFLAGATGGVGLDDGGALPRSRVRERRIPGGGKAPGSRDPS